MNVHDGIQTIVLPGEQKLRFDFFDESLEIGQRGLQFVLYRLTFAGQVYQRLSIVHLAGDLPVERESLFETRALLKGFAGAVLIGPEAWVADYGL
jgi:hypothetical protein